MDVSVCVLFADICLLCVKINIQRERVKKYSNKKKRRVTQVKSNDF